MTLRTFSFGLVCAALALSGCSEEGGVVGEITKYEREEAAKFAARADGAANARTGEQYLAANAKKDGWKTTASGLQYKAVRTVEKGPSPGPEDQVVVHYEGKFIDGGVFDSSYERNEPQPFPVSGVIPGWTEGLQLMKPGEEFEFAIPAALAYGADASPEIGPNQTLLFKVELLGIRKPDGKIFRAPDAG